MSHIGHRSKPNNSRFSPRHTSTKNKSLFFEANQIHCRCFWFIACEGAANRDLHGPCACGLVYEGYGIFQRSVGKFFKAIWSEAGRKTIFE